jgi:hypothetical protein
VTLPAVRRVPVHVVLANAAVDFAAAAAAAAAAVTSSARAAPAGSSSTCWRQKAPWMQQQQPSQCQVRHVASVKASSICTCNSSAVLHQQACSVCLKGSKCGSSSHGSVG